MPSQILVQFQSNSGSIVSGIAAQGPPPAPEGESFEPGWWLRVDWNWTRPLSQVD
jgi:hypothetical protein